jgi:hypothetical protein
MAFNSFFAIPKDVARTWATAKPVTKFAISHNLSASATCSMTYSSDSSLCGAPRFKLNFQSNAEIKPERLPPRTQPNLRRCLELLRALQWAGWWVFSNLSDAQPVRLPAAMNLAGTHLGSAPMRESMNTRIQLRQLYCHSGDREESS